MLVTQYLGPWSSLLNSWLDPLRSFPRPWRKERLHSLGVGRWGGWGYITTPSLTHRVLLLNLNSCIIRFPAPTFWFACLDSQPQGLPSCHSSCHYGRPDAVWLDSLSLTFVFFVPLRPGQVQLNSHHPIACSSCVWTNYLPRNWSTPRACLI